MTDDDDQFAAASEFASWAVEHADELAAKDRAALAQKQEQAA